MDHLGIDDRLAGGVWGHLVGDAMGLPYEFGPPVRLEEGNLAPLRCERMFDRTQAVIEIEAGKCACSACPGQLTDAAMSRGNWRFCRVCRCAWKVSAIDGQIYATAIHSPAHVEHSRQAEPHRPAEPF